MQKQQQNIIELTWIFYLGIEKNKFFVDKNHNCRFKKFDILDEKTGNFIEKNENFIIKPFPNINNFYGCTYCGKYHFCERSIKKCPLINTFDTKVCIFSGRVVSETQLVLGRWEDEELCKKESILNHNENFIKNNIIKKKIPLLNNNIKLFNKDQENIKISKEESNKNDNNNNNNNNNDKGVIFFSKPKSSESIKKDNNFDMDIDNKNITTKNDFSFKGIDYGQINPINIEFQNVLNEYFSFLDKKIEDSLDILTSFHLTCKKNCLGLLQNYNINNNNIIYHNLCENNAFLNKFEHFIKNNIENILIQLQIDDDSIFIKKEYYYKIISKILVLIYNSKYMNQKINKYKSKQKNRYIDINTYKNFNIDNRLIIAFKIVTITELCESLLLDCLLSNYFINNINGINNLIWLEDRWLIEQRKKPNNCNLFDSFKKKISKLIFDCLRCYHNYPLWLKSNLQ